MEEKNEKTERRIDYLPLSALRPAKRNPKAHDLDLITASVGRFGYVEPVVMDERTGRLVAGHGRVATLVRMRAAEEAPPRGVRLAADGQWRIPVLRGWSSTTDAEAEAYVLASNQSTIAGGWDDGMLGALLSDLADSDDLMGTGFTEDDVGKLLARIQAEAETEGEPPDTSRETPEGLDDVPELPKAPYVKTGDVYRLGRHVIYCGDSRDVLSSLEPASVHSTVTDPPYELGFMGKAWDASGVAYDSKLWAGVLRALPPGGHVLSFGATRTYHRMASALEDAGAEIRDCLFWCYGSGFPKSLDVSKAIDDAAGATRKVIGKQTKARSSAGSSALPTMGAEVEYQTWDLTAPATDEAKEWQGWGTALKPAAEPCVLARKPLEGTVADNVLAHGVGGLNVDGCRIGTEVVGWGGGGRGGDDSTWNDKTSGPRAGEARPVAGRWPANVLLDPEAAAMLDEQSGERRSAGLHPSDSTTRNGVTDFSGKQGQLYADAGGASRYFYVAKPARSERDAGLEDRNAHPTVKPVNLMRWLVRLVTPPGGKVLEPFSGSGTTLLACELEGLCCIAIEREPAYVQLAIARWEGLSKQKAVKVRGDDG